MPYTMTCIYSPNNNTISFVADKNRTQKTISYKDDVIASSQSLIMVNRSNFIFRVSIVINVVVLFYTALHLSRTYPSTQKEWVKIISYRSKAGTGVRNVREYKITQNEARTKTLESDARITERIFQKAQFTMPITIKTKIPSIASIAKVESKAKWQETASPAGSNRKSPYITDEDAISDATYSRLLSLLHCHDKDFLTEYLQRGEYWVLKNYVRADHGDLRCHETITYTTHADFKYLDNVQPLIKRWLAPVSLAIHAPGTDIVPTVNSIRYLRDCLGTDLIKLFVTFHVFFPYKHIPKEIPDPNEFLRSTYDCSLPPPYENVNVHDMYNTLNNLLYPVNVARNIARDSALTHFILPSDIELYPSPNLVPRFLNMIARNASPLNNSTNPRVFPISLFEVDANVRVPSTKMELQIMLMNKTAIPFQKHMCPHCHNLPQRLEWMTTPETSYMDIFHIGKRKGSFISWEPIFIGTHQDPHYDERLSWKGMKDKMTQGYILCVKNYDFMILNNAFLIHKPGIKFHEKSSERIVQHVARQTFFVKWVIMPELQKLFGTKAECDPR